ncbi:hypothetical protein PIB30_027597 [Stylosanthes scabra]|uniref:Uncharacterized protein n=1 Tax=Stylosanthes scabra TaxID=79078 RepID=A0ABU6X9X3_9FABA|nr:hypothetical protein [Stylosanthes scabra]
MAEVRGYGPGGVVREVEGAQIPQELNPLYSRATRDRGLPEGVKRIWRHMWRWRRGRTLSGRGSSAGGKDISFQQWLLQRCFVAPSQFHPNAWSAIRCFELVKEYLKLPQDPEVFLFLFTVFSPNPEGKSKKGYMPVCPGKKRRIFGLYEESFHDFKGRYFKVFPVGDHPPFWLTLERDAGRFPSYWSKDAGLNYTPVSYRTLNDEQRDTADILFWLFSKRPLKPKAVLGNPERARKAIVKMAGRNKTLAELRRVM